MRLLYIVSEYLPVSNAVSIRTSHNVRALEKDGVIVDVLTGNTSMVLSPAERNIIAVNTSAPSNKSGFIKRFFEELKFGCSLGFYILKNSKNYDSALITSPPFFMTCLCAFACRCKKLPYSIDVRDRYPQVFFSLGILKPNGLFGSILRSMEKRLYRKAQKVITVTPGLCNRISEDIAIDKVSLSMNGYTGFDEDPNVKTDEESIIIMHGNFGKFFDDQSFIKIAEELNRQIENYIIKLIGDGPKLIKLKELNLPRVEILQSQPHNQIIKLLKKSSIGLSIHSNDESMIYAFPVKVFEFIGAGIPSIVIPLNEAGKIVQEEGFGFAYSPDDWRKAVQSLVLLLTNPEIRDSIAEQIISKREKYNRLVQSANFSKIIRIKEDM